MQTITSLNETTIYSIDEIIERASENKIMLMPKADLQHESSSDWYDSLGYHVSTDEGDFCHPVCDIDLIESYEPKDKAEKALLSYAKDAKLTAESVEESLNRAVFEYKNNNLIGVLEALKESSDLEREYGDDPATQRLMRNLLALIDEDDD